MLQLAIFSLRLYLCLTQLHQLLIDAIRLAAQVAGLRQCFMQLVQSLLLALQ